MWAGAGFVSVAVAATAPLAGVSADTAISTIDIFCSDTFWVCFPNRSAKFNSDLKLNCKRNILKL
jgi:hypothetical protein